MTRNLENAGQGFELFHPLEIDQELFLRRVESPGEQAGREGSLAETFLGTSSQG